MVLDCHPIGTHWEPLTLQFSMQTQTFVITETMTTLPMMVLLGVGVLLLTVMMRTIRQIVQKYCCRGGVTRVVTSCVHRCVKFTIYFIIFGQRGRIPEFNFKLNWIIRLALTVLAYYGLRWAPILTLLIYTVLTILAMVTFWVARWFYRLYHAWGYTSQAFKDSVVGLIAFPICAVLCIIIVPACWLIVLAFRALELMWWLSFGSVRFVCQLISVLCFGQVQQQHEQQSGSSAASAPTSEDETITEGEQVLEKTCQENNEHVQQMENEPADVDTEHRLGQSDANPTFAPYRSALVHSKPLEDQQAELPHRGTECR